MRILKIQFAGDTQNKFMFLFREFKEEPLRLEVSIPLRLGFKGGGADKVTPDITTYRQNWPSGNSVKILTEGNQRSISNSPNTCLNLAGRCFFYQPNPRLPKTTKKIPFCANFPRSNIQCAQKKSSIVGLNPPECIHPQIPCVPLSPSDNVNLLIWVNKVAFGF